MRASDCKRPNHSKLTISKSNLHFFNPTMKTLILIATLALIAPTLLAGPISVSDNNVGDIVTVGVNVQANVTTDIRSNIVNILVALLTHVGELEVQAPAQEIAEPKFNLLEAIEHVKTLTAEPGLTKEQKGQIWQEQVEAMVQQVMGRKE
ncbi:hypothetical protein pipiens_015072 [Culex pipiens pipiens]|uniref:Uncharacterized protein n=1 Tax=Culex pipiens pipiens TaxID=38569 RepID=A0ABD1CRZ2_CULPP